MANVLFIECDALMSIDLVRQLEQASFSVILVRDCMTGLQRAQRDHHSIILLDGHRQQQSALDILRGLRAVSTSPIIMLGSPEDETDRILALEIGADDYIGRDTPPRELIARIHAILRRIPETNRPAAKFLVGGPLIMWPNMRTATWHNEPLALTSTEFSLLLVLLKHAGQIVDKSALSDQGMGRSLTRYDRSIDTHISSIRQKLGKRSDGRAWIETVRSQGYLLLQD